MPKSASPYAGVQSRYLRSQSHSDALSTSPEDRRQLSEKKGRSASQTSQSDQERKRKNASAHTQAPLAAQSSSRSNYLNRSASDHGGSAKSVVSRPPSVSPPPPNLGHSRSRDTHSPSQKSPTLLFSDIPQSVRATPMLKRQRHSPPKADQGPSSITAVHPSPEAQLRILKKEFMALLEEDQRETWSSSDGRGRISSLAPPRGMRTPTGTSVSPEGVVSEASSSSDHKKRRSLRLPSTPTPPPANDYLNTSRGSSAGCVDGGSLTSNRGSVTGWGSERITPLPRRSPRNWVSAEESLLDLDDEDEGIGGSPTEGVVLSPPSATESSGSTPTQSTQRLSTGGRQSPSRTVPTPARRLSMDAPFDESFTQTQLAQATEEPTAVEKCPFSPLQSASPPILSSASTLPDPTNIEPFRRGSAQTATYSAIGSPPPAIHRPPREGTQRHLGLQVDVRHLYLRDGFSQTRPASLVETACETEVDLRLQNLWTSLLLHVQSEEEGWRKDMEALEAAVFRSEVVLPLRACAMERCIQLLAAKSEKAKEEAVEHQLQPVASATIDTGLQSTPAAAALGEQPLGREDLLDLVERLVDDNAELTRRLMEVTRSRQEAGATWLSPTKQRLH